MAGTSIRIATEFHGSARLGILSFEGITVHATPDALKDMLNGLANNTAERFKESALGEIPAVQRIRAIFHRAGVDPTRYRPSSESLLRRAVKQKGLYFINSVVDLINYFSLQMLCPMGLYDLNRIQPPIEWRVGRDGESYEGIGRDRLNLSGFPLLVDAQGPFGSPISDSMRTRVMEGCSRILWITFAPPGSDLPLQDFASSMQQFNGGTVLESVQYDV